MQVHEFNQAYAKTPEAFRRVPIGGKTDPITLHDIYLIVKTIEDSMRPNILKMNELCNLAEVSGLLSK